MNKEEILSRFSVTSVPKKKVEVIIEEKKVEVDKSLKSPICSFLGHVDAGKTSLMDVIRNTDLTKLEAGGITQSIGSSFVSIESIVDLTKEIKGKFSVEPKIPGLLIIDTPGHEAFNNLRERGSSLCDIAILVIEMNDGIKPQTIESIKLLQEKKVPFVIAVTKLDLTNNIVSTEESSLRKVFKKQNRQVIQNIECTMEDIKYELEKEDVKAEFYFKNKKPNSVYSIIPVSSKTKEGIADLLALLIYISQNWMNKKITYKDKVDATIMECVQDSKLGWVLDIILKNGTIKIGDKFAVSGNEGCKIITIRKMFVKSISNSFEEKNIIRASSGIRLIGSNCNNLYTGTKLHPINNNENDSLENAEKEMENFWNNYQLEDIGVCLQAPTFGELDAMYNVFKEAKIKIMGLNIGKLFEKDINRTLSKLDKIDDKEYNCLLYFGKLNEKEEKNLNAYIKDKGINLLNSEIIYQLLDKYKKYKNTCLEDRKNDQISSGNAVYPCKIKILKQHIYMKGGSDNILMGVKILEGRLRIGSPLKLLPNKHFKKNKTFHFESVKELELGNVISMQKNNKDIKIANIDDEVCIRLDNPNSLLYDRHFNYHNKVVSKLTRASVDILKKDYRDDMTKQDWLLVVELFKNNIT